MAQAREVPELVGESLGIDTHCYPHRIPIMSEKVVDISELTNITDVPEQRVLLKYADTMGGRWVQLVQCYRGLTIGMNNDFYYDEAGVKSSRAFSILAAMLGMTPKRLLDIIREQAPMR
jgi:hypothetical protein